MKELWPLFLITGLAAASYWYLSRQKQAGKLPPLSGGSLAAI